jgi:catechol 2,3-dioxygenase-like lactoylglutathione lyase family enzyme
MAVQLKAVAFRTPHLQATKDFFAKKLGFSIKEYSTSHFVIHSKGIRLLFVQFNDNFEVELYVSKPFLVNPEPKLQIIEDPNSIKIIITKNART